MKKLLIAFALVLACQAGKAQTVENIFNSFKEKPGVEFVPVNKEMLQMVAGMAAQQNSEEAKAMEFMKNLEGINILSLEEAAADVKTEFLEMVGKMEWKDFEPIADVKEADEQITIYGKKDKDKITELIIVMSEPKEPGLIHITGTISLDDVQKVMEMNK
ncbi:DUF4252 domain-containing protein [Prevotella sp. Rep29]|uniref:DUF4252 domain-containing protein n=1 Tax=Prevotella sp. Rep29 TaxID=2691580 RepID=UPI001C6DECDC|nr:DUF4252 domain-containing protein [Prevotella sp. Rep29]QYR11532.1 DUF4252 domain-containing protein [Prevotella sp. Rep29]